MHLVKYDAAKKAIAEYKTVDEVKDFRDKALAVEAYAKQANDMELEWDAARARVRAERKCGELLSQLERGKAGGSNEHSVVTPDDAEKPKSEYADALDRSGISTQQSSNYQKLANVPEDEFEAAVELPGTKPSTNHILKPKPESEPVRMDKDALWLWGTLRDMRSKGTFGRPISELESEWTDGMKKDAAGLINQLITWVKDYE